MLSIQSGGFRGVHGSGLAMAYITSIHLPWPEFSPMDTPNTREAGKSVYVPEREENGFGEQQASFVTSDHLLALKITEHLNHRPIEY